MDPEDPKHALNVISLIEAILENPDQILRAQINKAKDNLVAELREEGASYEERMEELEKVEYPKPGEEFIYDTFNAYVREHPYLSSENIRPKSIAREIYETYSSFEDYIKTYKLEKAEAILLRHLSEVYKVLSQTVPPAMKTEEILAAEEHLEGLVRHTDSSLIDEWESLGKAEPSSSESFLEQQKPTPAKPPAGPTPHQQIWTFLKQISHHNYDAALLHIHQENNQGEAWSARRLEDLFYPMKSRDISEWILRLATRSRPASTNKS